MPRLSSTPRLHRHRRVRARLAGTSARPRLAVFRSLKHIGAQFIDDATGRTLVAVSDKALSTAARKGKLPAELAKLVGELAASEAKAKGISAVVFDRGGYAYHGRIRALAEGARAGGLAF